MRGLTARTSGAALALGIFWAAQSAPLQAQAFQATPTFTVGTGSISDGTGTSDIFLNDQETVLDWTLNENGPNTTFNFLPAGNTATYFGGGDGQFTDFTVLNRINSNFGAPTVQFNGNVLSDLLGGPGGRIWFYAPGGIIVGSGATFNVGSLLLTTDTIDVTGGLYGSNGEIRFRGAAGSTSKVQILGAAPGILQINTTISDSYVAIVAPRIEQGGTINADGSTALVAAEQADLTFNAGLFDVSVLVGSADANGIVHTGSTGGPASLGVADLQRVTMVAVAKNTAMTMLLSGSIGYVPAQVALQDGSAVQLSGGYSTSGDAIGLAAGGAPVGITIGNTTFTSKLGDPNGNPSVASGTIDISPTAFGTTQFQGDVALRSDTALNVTANSGETILFDGVTQLIAQQDGLGGTISFLAEGTPGGQQPVGAITVAQSLGLFAQGNVASVNTPPDAGLTGTGGAIDITAAGGTIATGNLQVDASATGGAGNITGGLGQAGSIAIAADNGTITSTFFTAGADATGGYGGTTGGAGQGGSVGLTVLGGGQISSPATYLSAAGGGGDAQSGVAGAGTGGIVSVVDQTGTLDLGDLSLGADGFGGNYAPVGGDGVGGQIVIDISGAAQNWTSLYAEANAFSGQGAYPGGVGGNATGDANAIKINIGGTGALTVGNTLTLSALALANPNSLVTGTGTGGGIAVSVNNGGSLAVGGLFSADASATVSSDSSPDTTLPSPTMTGGSVSVIASGGALIDLHDMTLSSNAESVPVDVSTGSATGGSVILGAESGASIVQNIISGSPQLTLSAIGIADNGTVSSNGTGGNVLLYAQDGSITTPGDVTLDVGARMGFNNVSAPSPGADARAGTATVEIRPGTNGTGALDFATLSILANGEADTYNFPANSAPDVSGDGGQGIGGTATLHLMAGTLNAGAITISSSGAGATSTPNFGGPTGFTAGSGLGGTSELRMDGGSLTTPSLTITSVGYGGSANTSALTGQGAANGGDGTGGTARLSVLGGSLTVNGSTPLSIDASGYGGLAMSSQDTAAGNGGAGIGGSAEFSESGLGTSISLPGVILTALGSGSDGGIAAVAPGTDGDGGNGTGGANIFKLADGSATLNDVLLQGDATSGAGAISGDAAAGSLAFSLLDANLNAGNVPTGFSRTINNLTFSASATVGSGSITQGVGTAGASILSVQAGAPAAALTLGGALNVTTLGDGPAANPGFALKVVSQPFTVAGDATIASAGAVTFDTAIGAPFHVGGILQITTPDSVSGTGPIVVDGNSQLSTGLGIDLGYLSSGGTTNLQGGSGAVLIGTDLESAGLVTASGMSIDITSLGSLEFTPLVSPGSIAISLAGNGQFDGAVTSGSQLSVSTGGTATFNAPVTGNIVTLVAGSDLHLLDTLNAVGALSVTTQGTGNAQFDAAVGASTALFNIANNVAFASTLNTSGALDLTAGGTATFNALASGTQITVTSGDINLGPSGRLGDAAVTSDLTLRPGAAVTTVFVGGGNQSGGYSLSQSEISRLQAQQSISIVAQNPSLSSVMEVGALSVSTLPNGNLGTQGQFLLGSNGLVNITGRIDFSAADPAAALLLNGDIIRVHRDTGGIALHDNSGALQGQLLMTANGLEVASEAAFADLSGLTDLGAISDRLGQVEGVPSDVGALSASQILVHASGHVYIQNSGTSVEIPDRRGFTANGFQIVTSGTPIDMAINGRITDPLGGYFTGYDAVSKVLIDGAPGDLSLSSINLPSTINGCVIGFDCAPRAPVGAPPPQDTIDSLIDNGTSRPDFFQIVPITIGDTTVLDSSPLLDEPVTSVGNEDLWQSGCDPAGTQPCE